MHANTQLGVTYLASGHNLLRDAIGYIHGNSKRHALVTTRQGKYLRVDADHLTRHIDQRATRVAGVDGRIGLDEWHRAIAW